jgi:hypothetical protein
MGEIETLKENLSKTNRSKSTGSVVFTEESCIPMTLMNSSKAFCSGTWWIRHRHGRPPQDLCLAAQSMSVDCMTDVWAQLEDPIITPNETPRSYANKHTKWHTCRHTKNSNTHFWFRTDMHISKPVITGVQINRVGHLHCLCVAEERPNQKLQFSIMLPHGAVGSVSICAL